MKQFTLKNYFPAKKKDGTPIEGTTKTGKPYKIYTCQVHDNNNYYSVYTPSKLHDVLMNLGDGSHFEAQEEENGNYKNLVLPSQTSILEDRVTKLEEAMKIVVAELRKKTQAEKDLVEMFDEPNF